MSSVPKGYKQTEVGVIPEEWESSSLGKCLLSPPSYGINAAAKPFSPNLPEYIRITDIDESGKYKPNPRVSVDSDSASLYYLETGDIVVARTGASVGKSYIHEEEKLKLVFAGFLIRIITDKNNCAPKYIFYSINTKKYWGWILANSVRSGQPGINGKELSSYQLPLPPLPEQKAIAQVLSDTDALIEALDQLLAKKKAIKQGAMQELLTGKRRLPGFAQSSKYKQTEVGLIPEDWEVKRLGEIGVFVKGSGVRKDQANSGNIPCVRYGELYTHHKDIIRNFNSWISSDIALTALKLQQGDILFAGSGETKEEIGKCAAFLNNFEAFAGGDIVVLRPINCNSKFFGYYLNTSGVNRQKSSYGQGDAVVHIGVNALSRIVIAVSGLPEQSAIAQVLSDMDDEIQALEAKREKYVQIKQGMMEQLLTGKVRLV